MCDINVIVIKMAKGGSSGGKSGGSYAGKPAGKPSSSYTGRTYGGIGSMLGSPLGYGKGYKAGTDGASLTDKYPGKKTGNILGEYLKASYGIAQLSDSMRTGQPFSSRINEGINEAYSQSPAEKQLEDASRYRNKDESDENEKPCALCGAPALKGSAFCARCIAGLN